MSYKGEVVPSKRKLLEHEGRQTSDGLLTRTVRYIATPPSRTNVRAQATVLASSQAPRLLRPRPSDLDGCIVRDASNKRAHVVALARHKRLIHRLPAPPKALKQHLKARRPTPHPDTRSPTDPHLRRRLARKLLDARERPHRALVARLVARTIDAFEPARAAGPAPGFDRPAGGVAHDYVGVVGRA